MVVFEKTKGLTNNELHYCPGCTHGIIHRLVAEALEELGEEVGENSLEDPAQLEENNNLSPAERLEAEVRRNLGLDNYEPPINEEEVKKRRELEKALEEAEREAKQSGERVRK